MPASTGVVPVLAAPALAASALAASVLMALAASSLIDGSALAAGRALLGEGDGRPGFAGARLGDTRDAALAALADMAAASTPARCTGDRLAPVDGRRAFPRERCRFDAVGDGAGRLAGRVPTALAGSFVDGRLVRLDASFAAGDGTADEGGPALLREALERRFGTASAADRWRIGEDVVALVVANGVGPGLVIVDGRLARRLPALADEL